MKKLISYLLIISSMIMFTACTEKKEDKKDKNEKTEKNTGKTNSYGKLDAASAAEVEVGCAKCMYSVEGETGCETAVKVDGKVYKASGVKIPAHDIGLCKTTMKAKVSGSVKDDKYEITGAELGEPIKVPVKKKEGSQ